MEKIHAMLYYGAIISLILASGIGLFISNWKLEAKIIIFEIVVISAAIIFVSNSYKENK